MERVARAGARQAGAGVAGAAALPASQSSFLVPAASPASDGVTLGGGENWAWIGVLGVTVFVSGPQILCGSR